ncbi:DUF711 family protein [Chloroflexia bacterium SDU3-3]|nr:DUF711 family protein [Chloroflexia bacterium SDU3-3]
MQIRTITVGAREDSLAQAAAAARLARARLEDAGYVVQNMRLALSLASNVCGDMATIARGAEELALEHGFGFVSLGPLEGDRLAAAAEVIGSTQAVFASAQIVTPDGQVLPEHLRAAAEAMVALAQLSPDGFGNMRFAALANVGPGSPFLPASYHDRGDPWLAIGPEASALAREAVRGLPAPGQPPAALGAASRQAMAQLTALIERHDAGIRAALGDLAGQTGVRYAGCDWSLAPRPGDETSVGAAIEAISGVPFGAWGTMAAVRALTAAIQAAQVTRLGFSGVMLPVLEDTVLAQRCDEGRYTLRDLLAFSAVCGTGLDTIPLPGDASAPAIAQVLAEVATLSATYRKPLTARLMPMAGLRAGDPTRFDLSADPAMASYFCAARALAL